MKWNQKSETFFYWELNLYLFYLNFGNNDIYPNLDFGAIYIYSDGIGWIFWGNPWMDNLRVTKAKIIRFFSSKKLV